MRAPAGRYLGKGVPWPRTFFDSSRESENRRYCRWCIRREGHTDRFCFRDGGLQRGKADSLVGYAGRESGLARFDQACIRSLPGPGISCYSVWPGPPGKSFLLSSHINVFSRGRVVSRWIGHDHSLLLCSLSSFPLRCFDLSQPDIQRGTQKTDEEG